MKALWYCWIFLLLRFILYLSGLFYMFFYSSKHFLRLFLYVVFSFFILMHIFLYDIIIYSIFCPSYILFIVCIQESYWFFNIHFVLQHFLKFLFCLQELSSWFPSFPGIESYHLQTLIVLPSLFLTLYSKLLSFKKLLCFNQVRYYISGDNEQNCPVSNLSGNTSRILPLRKMLTLGMR